MVDRYEHDITGFAQVLSVIAVLFDAVAVGNRRHASKPLPVFSCHRQFRVSKRSGRGNFTDIVIIPVVCECAEIVLETFLHVLWCCIAVECGRTNVCPGRWFLWHESVGTGRVGSVRNAEECVDAVQLIALYLSVLCVGDGNVITDK